MPASYINNNKITELFNSKRELKYRNPVISPSPLKLRSDPWSQAILLLYIQGALGLDAEKITVEKHIHAQAHLKSQMKMPDGRTWARNKAKTLHSNTFKPRRFLPPNATASLPLPSRLQEIPSHLAAHIQQTMSSLSDRLRGMVAHSRGSSALWSGANADSIHEQEYRQKLFELPHFIHRDHKPVKKGMTSAHVIAESTPAIPSVIEITTPDPVESMLTTYFEAPENINKTATIAEKALTTAMAEYETVLNAINAPVLHIASWLEQFIQNILQASGESAGVITGSTLIKTYLPPSILELPPFDRKRRVPDFSLNQIITKDYLRGPYKDVNLVFDWPEAITASMRETFERSDVQTRYLDELNQHLTSSGVVDNLKRYFDISWKARLHRFIRYNEEKPGSEECAFIQQFLENGGKPGVIIWDNKAVGHLFLVPFSQKITSDTQEQQVEISGMIFSTSDPRTYRLAVNDNLVSFLTRHDFDSFLSSHLSFDNQDSHQPFNYLSPQLATNAKYVVGNLDEVINLPRLTFVMPENLGEIFYHKFIANLQSDMDYLARSDREIYWDSIFNTLDMIGTMLTIASIPLTFGASTKISILKIAHISSSLALTSITSVIPKLVKAHIADRTLEASESLTDAVLALAGEGVALAVGATIKTAGKIYLSNKQLPGKLKQDILRHITRTFNIKTQRVNKLNIGSVVDLPHIDQYASRRLSQKTTLLMEELAFRRRKYQSHLVNRARKLRISAESRMALMSKKEILGDWLPNSLFNVYSNLWGKPVLSEWFNLVAKNKTRPLSALIIPHEAGNTLPRNHSLMFIGTDLRGIAINGSRLTFTRFLDVDTLTTQDQKARASSYTISGAVEQANQCAHWSPRLETARHEALRLIKDERHPQIDNQLIAPEVDITEMIAHSQYLLDRYHAGLVGSNQPLRDDIHTPVIIALKKPTAYLPVNRTQDSVAQADVAMIIAPEEVIKPLKALIELNSNMSYPYGYFSALQGAVLSITEYIPSPAQVQMMPARPESVLTA